MLESNEAGLELHQHTNKKSEWNILRILEDIENEKNEKPEVFQFLFIEEEVSESQ